MSALALGILAGNTLMVPHNKNLTDDTGGNYPGKMRMVENTDGSVRWDIWLYNGTGGACVAGRPYAVDVNGTYASPLRVATPATKAIYSHVVVALAATANAVHGWFAIQGFLLGVAFCKGAAIAIGDPLYVSNALPQHFQEDTAETTATVAKASAANTDNLATSTCDLYLPGTPVLVPAT